MGNGNHRPDYDNDEHTIPAPPDTRDLDTKYRHLAEEMVNLRVADSARILQITELSRRVRALEAITTLEVFADGHDVTTERITDGSDDLALRVRALEDLLGIFAAHVEDAQGGTYNLGHAPAWQS